MSAGIGAVHVKREHGVMVVTGRGQTPKGKAFIKKTAQLKAKSPGDPNFKGEMAQAIAEMLPQTPATPE